MGLAKMQAGSNPSAQLMMQSLELGGTGKTVALSFTVPAEVFDAVGGALNKGFRRTTKVNVCLCRDARLDASRPPSYTPAIRQNPSLPGSSRGAFMTLTQHPYGRSRLARRVHPRSAGVGADGRPRPAHRQPRGQRVGRAAQQHPAEAAEFRDAQLALVDDVDHPRCRRGARVDSPGDAQLQSEAAGQLRHATGREAGSHHCATSKCAT